MRKAKLTKRAIQGKQTRQKIFDTSLALFSEYGYENVTIDDICEKIGVSKGAFYTHFKSKDQVILENFIHLNTYYDEVFDEISSIKSSLGKLYSFQHYVMKNVEKIGYEAVKLVYHLESAPHKKKSFLISKKHNLYKIIMAIVREGQKSGEIRKDKSADTITSMMVQLYRGIILDWCLDNGSYSLAESTARMAPLIYAGIKIPGR
jgi:TetR/AcrR family transcriptional regulator, cholesterol catabolism regulator